MTARNGMCGQVRDLTVRSCHASSSRVEARAVTAVSAACGAPGSGDRSQDTLVRHEIIGLSKLS
jgi:hypothetical protein